MKIYTYILLSFAIFFTSCIHDDTTGYIREISEISIQVPSDSIYVKLPNSVKVSADVKQTMDGYKLSYEWKTAYINGYNPDGTPDYDSLVLISDKPVLEHFFKRTGRYWLRLRVFNEFGSSFHYMTVFVRAGAEEGLLVLSADEKDKSRISFLETTSAKQVLELTESDFKTDLWSMMNDAYELSGARDIIVSPIGVFLSSETQQAIYQLTPESLEVMAKNDVSLETPWLYPLNMAALLDNIVVFSRNGKCAVFAPELGATSENSFLSEKSPWDRMYVWNYIAGWFGSWNVPLLINREAGKVDTFKGIGDSTGKELRGRKVLNAGVQKDNEAIVISTAKDNPRHVKVTAYRPYNFHGHAFKSPRSYQYEAASDLTLDGDAELVSNHKYDVFFYFANNRFYRWRYANVNARLPESPENLTELTGEICCIAQSPDHSHIYIGTYDKTSSHNLKGNVYVYDADKLTLIRKFIGIADKPIKLIYKTLLKE